MPGIIDAMSYYGIAGEDMNEVPNPLTPELRIIEAFCAVLDVRVGRGRRDPCARAALGGVTATYIGPGDATVVGGQGAVVKTAGGAF